MNLIPKTKMNIDDIDFERLVRDIAVKHFDIPGSPTIANVIHYCLFDKMTKVGDLAIKCQDILFQMGYTADDLFWKRRNDGRMCEKLFDDLDLDFEFDSDNGVFDIIHRKYPKISPIKISVGHVMRQNESIWTRIVDCLYEAKLDKYSWLYGYSYCNKCPFDDIKSDCDECGGTGHVRKE